MKHLHDTIDFLTKAVIDVRHSRNPANNVYKASVALGKSFAVDEIDKTTYAKISKLIDELTKLG